MSFEEESQRDSRAEFLEPGSCGSGLSRRLLDVPGGYLWWYVDLIDARGNGLVVIWSFGLPFLPGYIDAVRRGRGQKPRHRPSLNVCTYRGGALDFYLLQEFGSDEVQWRTRERGEEWRYGASTIRSQVCRNGWREVVLDLKLDVPGLQGPASLELRGQGPAVRRHGGDHDPLIRRCEPLPVHDWVPLVWGHNAEGRLATGGEEQRFRGRFYHDRNGGAVALNELGLKRWLWWRVALSGGELVCYAFDGPRQTQYAMWSIDEDGRFSYLPSVRLERRAQATNRFGLSWWPSMTVDIAGTPWLSVEHSDVVDSGPFYLRSLLRATDRRGRSFPGVAEVCEPGRTDRNRHRPLVRMRVHRRQGENSMWLPLFSGPRRGRVRRLLRSIFRGKR